MMGGVPRTAAHELQASILADQGYDLDKTVKRLRRDGESWASIARWITNQTHRPVTHETLRRWYNTIT